MSQDDGLRVAVTTALEAYGLARTAARLQIPPESVLRIATAQPVRGVTKRLALANVSKLETRIP